MNRHFQDARYYLKRAVENAVRGVRTELEPLEEWVRAKTGRERQPEPGRVEKVRLELRELPERIEDEAGVVLHESRSKLKTLRGRAN